MSFLRRVVDRWSTRGVQIPRNRYMGGPLLDYARTPDPAWQAALDAATMTGDGEQVARLWLQWVPGDPWQPVHRWFVFQLQPWAHVPLHIKRELLGPHPRTNAMLVYQPKVINGVIEQRPTILGGPCRSVDRLQWEMHRAYERAYGLRVFPRYTWVIQGDAGGHPFQTGSEEKMLRAAQGIPDVPSAGDAPYAPFDSRVIAAITRYDLWRYAHGLGDPLTATAEIQIARQVATERDANRMVWAMKEAVGAEVADGMAFAARQDGLHYHRWRPVGVKPRETDWERMKHQYINDTSLTD